MHGKTTAIFEEAIELLSEIPENHKVYVTGAHYQWLHELAAAFKHYGLVGVVVLTPDQIMAGGLRGCKGRLLIDDANDMNGQELFMLLTEKEILEMRSR